MSNTIEAKVTEARSIEEGLQELDLLFLNGEREGESLTIEHEFGLYLSGQEFEEGDSIVVVENQTTAGETQFIAMDHVRRPSLVLIFAIFVFTVVIVNRKKGLLSLLAMLYSFAILFLVVLPLLLKGISPVPTAILGATLIAPVSFTLSHGWNKKTAVAVAGTLISLVITGVLAALFAKFSHLTGLAAEEAAFLFTGGFENINFQGLTLAGIIIAGLGVLDDVCITQSSVVKQLKSAQSKLKFKELFNRGMEVGRDHITSVVNTLILVYTGASLPLLLLFMNAEQSLGQVLNYEILAEEIVRTLTGSIGLVLAVPITTALAAYVFSNNKKRAKH